jgi:hypothetical protein
MITFLQRLKDAGVEPRIRKTRTGKVQGISYELEGIPFPGNKLGRNYSYQGLQKLGVVDCDCLEPPSPAVKTPVNRKPKTHSSGLEL